MLQFRPIDRPVMLEGLYTAFEENMRSDYVFRGETHDFYELVLVTEGTVGVTAGTDSFMIDAPTAILHPPMEFHSIRAEGGTSPTILVFSFEASRFPDLPLRIFSLSEKNIARAAHILKLLRSSTAIDRKNVGATYKGMEREAQRALLELELLLLALPENEDAARSAGSSSSMQNFRRALEIMEENLHLPLSTQELAKLTHMSPSLLKKIFARYAGMGVMEYFRTRRINATIPLLREGRSVQDVARQFGFSDAGYLSTVFRRVTGFAPTHYRRH